MTSINKLLFISILNFLPSDEININESFLPETFLYVSRSGVALTASGSDSVLMISGKQADFSVNFFVFSQKLRTYLEALPLLFV